MTNTVLADAGPVIALFDRDDRHHENAVKFIKQNKCLLMTTWPVVTEASHMLSFSADAQSALLKWIQRGGLKVAAIEEGDIPALIRLTEKYRDLPMDLADASLVVLAEKTGIRKIISIDSDFDIYRVFKKEHLENIFKVK